MNLEERINQYKTPRKIEDLEHKMYSMTKDEIKQLIHDVLEYVKPGHSWSMYEGEDPYKQWNDCVRKLEARIKDLGL